jgi:MoxR-like ATPase
VFFSESFLVERPILKALRAERTAVLLIDEIDRADEEFEAFLLEFLSDFQVSIPEIGTVKATHRPLVVLTSNRSRELSEALKRRCLHLQLDYPSSEVELEIVRIKAPEIREALAAELVQTIQRLRTVDLRKAPSIGETLDWAQALVVLGADSLSKELIEETLSVIVKYDRDADKARQALQLNGAKPDHAHDHAHGHEHHHHH